MDARRALSNHHTISSISRDLGVSRRRVDRIFRRNRHAIPHARIGHYYIFDRMGSLILQHLVKEEDAL